MQEIRIAQLKPVIRLTEVNEVSWKLLTSGSIESNADQALKSQDVLVFNK